MSGCDEDYAKDKGAGTVDSWARISDWFSKEKLYLKNVLARLGGTC